MPHLIWMKKIGAGTALQWNTTLAVSTVNWGITNNGLQVTNNSPGTATSIITTSKPIPNGKWFWEIQGRDGGNRWSGVQSADNLPSIEGTAPGNIQYGVGIRPDGPLAAYTLSGSTSGNVGANYGPPGLLFGFDTGTGELRTYYNNTLISTITNLPTGGDQMYVAQSLGGDESVLLELISTNMENVSAVSTLQGQGYLALS